MDRAWIDGRYRAVDKRDEVSRVLAWLRGRGDERPVVFDGKTPFGTINPHAVPGHRIRHDTRVDDVTLPVPCLHVDDDRDGALAKFLDAGTAYLPVQREDPPGCLGVVDALRVLADLDDGPPARASSLQVEPLRPGDSIDHAQTRFAARRADRLPVVDTDGTIVGALERGRAFTVQESFQEGMGRRDRAGDSNDVGDETVDGFMEDDWCELPPQADYRECLESVQTYGTCFVTDHGRFVGILDPRGLVRGQAGPGAEPEGMPLHFRQPKAAPATR